MISEETKYRILLNMVPGIGPVSFRRALDAFGSAGSLKDLSFSDLMKVFGEQPAQRFAGMLANPEAIEKEIELLEKHRITVLTWDDAEYPDKLRKIQYPPPVIYYQGDINFLSHELPMSVVGTRKPTTYGKEAASDFAKQLVQSNFCTVSGFALGIDSIVHRETIKQGGITAAVLGCGLLVEYPYQNNDIRKKVAERGALISEFPLNSQPLPDHFPRRNRIIAGLGLATLVIEADIKSGSMITVWEALQQGKEVFAVPGSIYSPYSRGTNKLIAQGAVLTRSVEDITNVFNQAGNYEFKFGADELKRQPADQPDLEESERNVFELIGWEPVNVDSICAGSQMASYEIAKILIDLELKGFVKSLPGKQYIRNKH